MPDVTTIETTRSVLKDLFDIWDQRARHYGRVLYGAALAEQLSVWKVVLFYLLPLHKEDSTEIGLDADYGDFRIARGVLSLGDAQKTLQDLVDTDTLSLPMLPQVRVTASMHPTSSVHIATSAEKRFPLRFPAREFTFSVSDTCKSAPPQDRLYSVNHPAYPRGDVAIEDLLNVHLGGFGAYSGTMIALAPDYRARISELRLSNNGVQIRIECLSGSDEEELIGKLYSAQLNSRESCHAKAKTSL